MDLNSIENKLKDGLTLEALSDYISLINDENESIFSLIFAAISRILLEKDALLTLDQLEVIKPFIDTYDEEVQKDAIKIYIHCLKTETSYLLSDIDFAIEQLTEFESIIRESFLDFFAEIDLKVIDENNQEKIIKNLLKMLKDDLWPIKLKVVQVFEHLLELSKDLLYKFHNDFSIILEESDLDVAREALDFYLLFIRKCYNPEDIRELFLKIPNSSWVEQRRILWIINKVGNLEQNSISLIRDDLVMLFDHPDVYLQKEAKNTVNSLMNVFPESFDSIFLPTIIEEKIDNTEAIEYLMSQSILRYEFPRFCQIFGYISVSDIELLALFENVVKKVNESNPTLNENLFRSLIAFFIDNPNEELCEKLNSIFKRISSYNILLAVYNKLSESSENKNNNLDKYRKGLISNLLALTPELGYDKMSKWLNKHIMVSPVDIKFLCSKFNIKREQLLHIINNLIQKGFLDAVIHDDMIQKPTLEQLISIKPDLLFLKKWVVQIDKTTNTTNIDLHVSIKNISDLELDKITIVLNYPTKVLKLENHIAEQVKQLKILKPNQSSQLLWNFQRIHDAKSEPKILNLKLVILYHKEEKLHSLTKKLDVLFV